MKDCNSCGKCCIKYGNGGLSASDADLEGWALFNPDIDAYVRDGEIWMDPQTGQQLDHCPWLRKVANEEVYHCDIYLDRPEDCRHYPSTVVEMIRDGCEMIEPQDLRQHERNPSRAQRALDKLMSDSRPGRS